MNKLMALMEKVIRSIVNMADVAFNCAVQVEIAAAQGDETVCPEQ